MSIVQSKIFDIAQECDSVYIPLGSSFALGSRGWARLFGNIEESTFKKNYLKKYKVKHYQPGNEMIVLPEHLLERIPLIDPLSEVLDDGEEES